MYQLSQAFEQWSATNLGQWHYVLGYTITLINHNWPIVLALLLALIFGVRLYLQPSRVRVCWLFGALLFVLGYEYDKHVADELHRAIDFLFGREISAWNLPLHSVVGQGFNTILLLAFLAALAQALWLSFSPRLRRPVVLSHATRDSHGAESPELF